MLPVYQNKELRRLTLSDISVAEETISNITSSEFENPTSRARALLNVTRKRAACVGEHAFKPRGDHFFEIF